MPKANPWAGIQQVGALDQKLYRQGNNTTPTPTNAASKGTHEHVATAAHAQPPSVNEKKARKAVMTLRRRQVMTSTIEHGEILLKTPKPTIHRSV